MSHSYILDFNQAPNVDVFIVTRKGQKFAVQFSEGGYGFTIRKTTIGAETEQITVEPISTNKILIK